MPKKLSNAARKKLEAKIYNDKNYKSRPAFGSFFDYDVFPKLMGEEYRPDIKKLLKKHLKNKKVLVLGASEKDVSIIWPYTKNIHAIDISERMISELKKTYPKVNAYVADAEKLETINGKYDVVFCKSILHHLHPLSKIINDISSLLKKDGLIFIASEPGKYNPLAFTARHFMPSNDHTPGEEPYNYSEFEKVVEKKFKIIYKNYYFLFSMLLAFVPTKLPILKAFCLSLIKPIISIEKLVKKLPPSKHLYWLTVVVAKKSTSPTRSN